MSERKVVRSLMIKPASSACNLNCTYCFYRDEASNRVVACHPPMTMDTARNLLVKILDGADGVHIGFQGGEPSLVGLDWFRHFFALAEEVNTGRVPISWFFQTNGTLLDDEWGEFFRKKRVLVGISADGFPRLHNLFRRTNEGARSSSDVERGIQAMVRQGVDFNILIVVTNEVCDNLDALWDYFLDRGLVYHQYIACMDPLHGDENRFLSPEKYGRFLVALFDKYDYAIRSGRMVSIRLFENWMNELFGVPPEACDMRGICSVQYVSESDGTIYPCDFCCTDEFELGNINRVDIEDIDRRREDLRFVERGLPLPEKCRACQYVALCRNGCPRYRDSDNLYRFCESFIYFFSHRFRALASLAEVIARTR